MKKITFLLACGLLLAGFGIRSTNAQVATANVGPVDTTYTPGGYVWGQFFGDYSYKVHGDSLGNFGSPNNGRGNSEYSTYPKNFANEQLRRVYLGYTYNISRDFTTQWLAAYEEGSGNGAGNTTLTAAGERSFYMKYANIQWKNIFPNATAIFGAQATPAFVPTSETQWGYRSIEKTITDKYGIEKSSDVGLGLFGAFDNARTYGYDILYADGFGQKLPSIFSNGFEQGRYKKVYADLWAWFFDKKIFIQLYGDDYRLSGELTPHDANMYKLYVAYNTVPLTVGFEGFMYNIKNGIVDTLLSTKLPETHDVKTIGLSFFATAQIIPNSLNVFARFDMFNPNGDLNFDPTQVHYASAAATPIQFLTGNGTNAYGAMLSTKENFIVAGLDYTPYKNVHIMPNIWYNSYASQPVGNYSKLQGSAALASDNEIVARLTMYYRF